jgi:peptide/nickel transport system substrate-binding protein
MRKGGTKLTMKKLLIIPLAIILMTGLVLSGCAEETPEAPAPVTPTPTPEKPAAEEPAAEEPTPTPTAPAAPTGPTYGGILIRPFSTGPATPIGWPVEADPLALEFADPCVEQLLRDDEAGELVPFLATDWTVAPDKSSVTFNLRQGVTFHDGTDWNARAAKWNLDAYIDAGKLKTWTSVDIVNDYAIRVNLSGYDNAMFSGRLPMMVSPTSVELNGLDWAREHPVGTGPFKFVSYKRDVGATYERYDNYWNEGQPYLDGIEFVIIPDSLTQQMAFERGEIHTAGFGGQQGADMREKGYLYTVSNRGAIYGMFPSSGKPASPLSNKKVRLACEYAIDREAIAAALGFGFMEARYQIYEHHPMARLENIEERRYDPEKAKALLTEAGYPDGFKTRLIPQPRHALTDALASVQQYWSVVGIEAEVDVVEEGLYAEYRYQGWDDGYCVHGLAPFASFTNFLKFYMSGNTHPSMALPEGYPALYDAALGTTFIEKDEVQAAAQMIFDEAMLLPLYQGQSVMFYMDGVHDLGTGEWGDPVFWTPRATWLEEKAWIK